MNRFCKEKRRKAKMAKRKKPKVRCVYCLEVVKQVEFIRSGEYVCNSRELGGMWPQPPRIHGGPDGPPCNSYFFEKVGPEGLWVGFPPGRAMWERTMS
jgi:hypothetical protein